MTIRSKSAVCGCVTITVETNFNDYCRTALNQENYPQVRSAVGCFEKWKVDNSTQFHSL